MQKLGLTEKNGSEKENMPRILPWDPASLKSLDIKRPKRRQMRG